MVGASVELYLLGPLAETCHASISKVLHWMSMGQMPSIEGSKYF